MEKSMMRTEYRGILKRGSFSNFLCASFFTLLSSRGSKLSMKGIRAYDIHIAKKKFSSKYRTIAAIIYVLGAWKYGSMSNHVTLTLLSSACFSSLDPVEFSAYVFTTYFSAFEANWAEF